MTVRVISPDAANQIDGSANHGIYSHLPQSIDGVKFVPVSWFPDFVFHAPTKDKRWILCDFMESHAPHPEYNKFWKWVEQNPPALTFRRELKQLEVSDTLKPICWACSLEIPPLQTKEQFDARKIEVLHFWGYSHESRPRLHAQFYTEGLLKHGIEILSQWEHLDIYLGGMEKKRTWATVHVPHWARRPMHQIQPYLQQSKIMVSLPGNGSVSFRSTEGAGTVTALWYDGTAFPYEWNMTNSVPLKPQDEFHDLELWSQNPDLYEIYVNGQANLVKYHENRFATEYMVPIIESVL